MIYDEVIKLREKVCKNLISVEEAKELYFASSDIKSWHTKDWQNRKNQILKDCCEQCGGTKILTLQHFFHPRDFGKCKYEAVIKYGNIFQENNPIDKLVTEYEVLTEANSYYKREESVCPKCNGSYRTRQTKSPTHICTRCSYEFDVPEIKILPEFVDDRKNALEKKTHQITFSGIREGIYFDKIKELSRIEFEKEIEKDAMLAVLDDAIRYLSFADTKTYCKKCAFNYDKNNADLCPICRKKYKKIYYPTCKDCLPLEKKKELHEFQDFKNFMDGIEKMHEDYYEENKKQ